MLSRIDGVVDGALPDAWHGTVAIAIAQRTYLGFRRRMAQADWLELAGAGARPQRLLWASTAPKSADLPDTHYVEALAGAGVIATLPEKILQAFADHGVARRDAIELDRSASDVLARAAQAGVDLQDVAAQLERDGVDAFLTVLAEDTRFRNLPVAVTAGGLAATYDLPNLEIIEDKPARIADLFLPLVRQHAFEARLYRTLKSLDAGGLLDPRTGLLTIEAFHREFATAIHQTQSQGGILSIARFSLGPKQDRPLFDAARILSRLMRRMDFGALESDGSIFVVFTDTDLRNAHMIARRLSSVMKHTAHSTKREQRIDPRVVLASSLPNDSAKSLLARPKDEASRAAS